MIELAGLAEFQQGLLTRGQAIAAGASDDDLRRAVRSGVLRRLRRGCYTAAPAYAQLSAADQHVLLARAAVACQLGQVALTGPSAAALHGLNLHGQDLDIVHLVRLDAGSARHQTGIKHHVLTHDITKDLMVVSGLTTVTPARSVWEVATTSSLESGVCTLDSALRRWPDLPGELSTISATFSRRPGSRRARLTMALGDGRADSPGESISRVLFHRFGVPPPQLQHEVVNSDGEIIATTDFYWPDHRHVGEFDGKVKYSQLLRPHETPGDAVFREKQREDAVRAELLGMTRWTWRDLMPPQPPAFIRRLLDDLERSRKLYVRRSA